MSKFCERLKDLFKSECLSTISANQKIGISKTQLGKYLSGYYLPSLKNAIKICNYFHCSLDFLCGTDEIKNRFDLLHEPSFSVFIKRYSELLLKNNISHYQLTKQIKINRNNLDYWKSKRTLPTLDILKLLAQQLNTTIEYLIGRTDEEK